MNELFLILFIKFYLVDMSAFNEFLIWLLCIGIAALIIGYFLKKSTEIRKHEGFQAIITCPDNSEQIVDERGRNNCCNGKEEKNENGVVFCSGNIICSLTESFTQGSKTVPLCTQYIKDNNDERSKNLCPDNMKNLYFQDSTKSFCSKSSSIPPDLNEPYCVLYNNATSDTNFLDSCQNFMKKRELDLDLKKCENDLKTLREQCSVNPSSSPSTPPVPEKPILPYDNLKTYTTGDRIRMPDGSVYIMTEFIGAGGYSPSDPRYAKNFSLVSGPTPESSSTATGAGTAGTTGTGAGRAGGAGAAGAGAAGAAGAAGTTSLLGSVLGNVASGTTSAVDLMSASAFKLS
jgi:hypothetical protein